jgi:hypothetical protein
MSDTQPGKRQKQTTVLGNLVTRLLANSFPDAPNQLLMVDMCANNLAGLLEKAARDATNDDGQYSDIDDKMTQFSVTRPTANLSPVKLEFIFYFDTDEKLSVCHRETYCESGDQSLDLFPEDFSMTAIELECFDTIRSSSYSVIFDVSNDSVATLSCSAGLQFIGDWSKLIAELCGDALVYGQWARQFDISATTASATALAIDDKRHWTGLQGKLHHRILIGMLSTEQPARFMKARVASDTVNLAFAAGDYLQILGDYSSGWYTGVHMESKEYGYISADSVVPVRPGTDIYDTLLRQLMPTWQYPTLALYPNRQAKYTDPHTGLLQTITWRDNSVSWQVGTGPGAVTVVYDSTTLHIINIQPHADTAYLGGLPSFKQICALYAPTASSTADDVQRWLLASVGVPATSEVDGSYLCGLTAPELGKLLDIDAERAKQIKALLSPVSTYVYGCISVTVLADQIAHVKLVAGTRGARSVVSECHIPILCPFYIPASNVDICWNNQRSGDWHTGTIEVGPNTGILFRVYDDSAKPCTHFARSTHMLQFAYEWNLHVVDAYDVTPHALFAPHMSIGNVRCNPDTGFRASFVLSVNSANKKEAAFIMLSIDWLSLYVNSFFYSAKINFPAEYARIMALIKTRRRTPLGLLNDAIATFSASPAFSAPPSIKLTDLWSGYSSGGVVAPKVTCTLTFNTGVEDVVTTDVVTGSYTLHHRRARRGDNTAVPEGAFAIKSDDLKNTATRALATYRLGIGPNKTNAQLMKTGYAKWRLVMYPEDAPLIGAEHASSITGTSYPIQTITTFGNDGTETTIRPATFNEQDMCNFVAKDDLKQVTIMYHKTQELVAEYIIQYTKDDLNKGAVGSSGLGWTPQEYQIYETIKNYDLLSIARWGYYGKLYGLDKQPLRGYGKLRSSFCDLCIGPRQPVPMLNSPTGQTRF